MNLLKQAFAMLCVDLFNLFAKITGNPNRARIMHVSGEQLYPPRKEEDEEPPSKQT